MKYTNRLISLLLCILLLSGVACLSVGAAVLYPVGDWVYEKINSGTEFEIDTYNGSYATVTTPSAHNYIPITSIGTGAFMGNEVITKVSLNKNVYAVQDHAFLNCVNLETVVFLGNVNSISYSAFTGCSSLSSINLEDTTITQVSSSCFMNCDALTEVTLPDTVVSINDNAFAYCDSLSKITIPASVTTIDEDAFYNTANVVIYCYTDSAAHTFAQANEIEFVLLDQEVETYVCGDADNDGEVSVMDASAIQLVLASKKTDEDGRLSIRGDVDGDGELSVMDATAIQLFIAEKLTIETQIGNILEY